MSAARCPRCEAPVSREAGICPSCRVELGLCSWCRDLTGLDPGPQPHLYTCHRCGRMGRSCLARRLGAYCNGLARAGRGGGRICARCRATLLDAGKTVVAWTLIGLLGQRLKPRG